MTSLTDRVDMLFSEWDRDDSPGCVIAIIQAGDFVYKRGYGMADLERGTRITPQSVFDLGSTGKQFTAAVVAILASQGYLSLDNSVRTHLPEMPAYADRITIRHLIHHTSGLRDYLSLLDIQGMPDENRYAEDYLFGLIAAQRGLNFRPGREVMYSNSGYFLLGYIARRVTGRHITDLIREHILEPLGMRHTTFNRDYRPLVRDRAMSYDRGDDGTFTNAVALCGGFGDGAILSNVEDLLLWDRNFYDNRLNGAQPDLIEQLHEPGRLKNGKPITYAFGLVVDKHYGLTCVSHAGSWAGYRAEMMRFPEKRFTVICMSNLGSIDPSALCYRVAGIYLELEKDSRPAKGNDRLEAGLASFTGIYQGKYQTVELTVRDHGLFLTLGTREYALRHAGGRKFRLADLPDDLVFSGRNNERLHFIEYGVRTEGYRRIAAAPADRPELSGYAATYRCRELGLQYELELQEEGLQIRRNAYDKPSPLTAIADDTLIADFGELRFRRRGGRVVGFSLYADRAMGLRFQRIQ